MSSRPVCLPGQASSISSLHSPASGYRPSKCLQMHRCHAAPGHLVWGFPRRYSLGREPEYFRVTCNLQFIRREFRAAGWARWAICRDAKCLFPTELNLGCLFLQSVKRTAACTAVPCTHHGAVPPLLSLPPPHEVTQSQPSTSTTLRVSSELCWSFQIEHLQLFIPHASGRVLKLLRGFFLHAASRPSRPAVPSVHTERALSLARREVADPFRWVHGQSVEIICARQQFRRNDRHLASTTNRTGGAGEAAPTGTLVALRLESSKFRTTNGP